LQFDHATLLPESIGPPLPLVHSHILVIRNLVRTFTNSFAADLYASQFYSGASLCWFIVIPLDLFTVHGHTLPLDASRPHLMSVAQTPISGDTLPIPAQGVPGAGTVAHSLEYADELYGSTYEVMEKHYNEEGSYLGQGALNLFCQALYGHPFQ
jgi:hypothetical protein